MDETELKYEGRDSSEKDRLDFVQGTLIGALELLARVRASEGTHGNCVTIAVWLRMAAEHMDVLAERHERRKRARARSTRSR